MSKPLAMTNYWCRFFDANGRVMSAERIDAVDDRAVIAQIRVIQSKTNGSGFDVRDGKRRVAWVNSTGC
jgi:hypothetical protein